VGGSEHVISYCAEEHGGRGVYLNTIEKDYSGAQVEILGLHLNQLMIFEFL
jgi:hypothetical protein